MGRIASWIARKAVGMSPQFRAALMGGTAHDFPAGNYQAYVDLAYKSNPYAGPAIRRIATDAAHVPLVVYKRTGKTLKEVEAGHPLVVTLKRPNAIDSGVRFRQRMNTHWILSGSAYALAVASKEARPLSTPMELYSRRPDWMQIIPGTGPNDGPIKEYKFTENGEDRANNPRYAPDEVLRLFEMDPLNDLGGMSLVQPAWRSIMQNNESGRWNYSLLKNQARPGLAFISKSPEPLTDEQFTRANERIQEKYAGPSNAGKHIVLDAFDIKPVGLNAQEMEWVQGIKITLRETGVALWVPSVLLGDVENATYSNMQTAMRLYYELNIFPMLSVQCADMTHFFSRYYGDDIEIGYDRDKVTVLAEDRAAEWARIANVTFLTENEKREALGYATEDGLDVFMVSAGQMPVTAEGMAELAASATDVQTATDTSDTSNTDGSATV